ncbi:transcription factor Opi1-domain-containing protein [Chaetomium sp. MPI-SDFR-AT-0129]|nr:transcription factor Opi1-domain-containing protein [Chaetomium sp. MPI-SDFR-AT-0129]
MPGPPDHHVDNRRAAGDFSLQLPPLAPQFPSDPTTELPPIQVPREHSRTNSTQTLPPLSSLTGPTNHSTLPNPSDASPHQAPYPHPPTHWPSLNPFTTYYTPSYLDPESSPSMSSDPAASRSVSLDDPDVRMAAEALGQMRTESGSSPRNRETTPSDRKTPRDYHSASPSRTSNNGNVEPLLSLITTTYPFLGNTIEGAASAYNTGKNYSPHLKSGAEYFENLVKPAVETVGRKTGVEGGMRWLLSMRGRKQRPSADLEPDGRENKRRRPDLENKGRGVLNSPPQDVRGESEDRRMSISTVDTLPAYDDQKSPAYTESVDDKTQSDQSPSPNGQQWGQRFVVTTSGLGVAMKDESMKSLRYCLKVVKNTNGYLGEVLVSLRGVIDEYDRTTPGNGETPGATETGEQPPTPRTAEDRNRLILRMTELRDELYTVIQRTVQTVSKYTGSALPENARNLVHSQLMSLPARYQFHYLRQFEARQPNASPDAFTRESAHLALLFAKEALQMTNQVGDVLNRTLMSAEQWCNTLYRKNNEHSPSPIITDQSLPATPGATTDRDVDMSG